MSLEETKSKILERIKIRKSDLDEPLANELIETATDRIALRVEELEFPEKLNSIAVEVVIVMLNKNEYRHEGVASEGVDTFSIKFVEKVLDEYEKEFTLYKKMRIKENNKHDGIVVFK